MSAPARTPPPPARGRLLLAAAIAAAALAILGVAEAHGRTSRVRFSPARPGGRRVAAVGSAADALRIWKAAGIRGSRLVVLTGQWSRPGPADLAPAGEGDAAGRPGDDVGGVTAEGALYAAVRLGVARAIDVVMPPGAFTHQLGEVRDAKGIARGDGAFRLPYHGVERRFWTPRAFVAPGEPALVLVEPSWFGAGAPPDPLAWLAAAGVAADLALVALDDPAASDDERRAALAFTRAIEVPWVEADE